MRKRFFGLKRPKIRQSWNKHNLYNLSRAENPKTSERTYFQQKWTAKALTRAYHGETIREKHWQRMFRPTMRSVVPMEHKYLAMNDGSEQALGRGSGLELPPGKQRKPYPRTPYMNMVYAPTERRLDTAVWRALFASSTRQARQFIVHGYVKVNGKEMIYPGYQLNPGDMFQVDPERVLYATGAPKDRMERRAGRMLRVQAAAKNTEEETSDTTQPAQEATPDVDSTPPHPKETLTNLISRAKSILSSDAIDKYSGKRKKDLRDFQRTLRATLSRVSKKTTLTDDLDAQLLELTSKLNISALSPPNEESAPSPDQKSSLPATQTLKADEERIMRAALQEARENPIDPSKPYATPWRPRDYMSAFAFVPRYLEVNHKICSAVYVRHPVARPGLAEVPTPYGSEMNMLAFNWYLRRR